MDGPVYGEQISNIASGQMCDYDLIEGLA